MKKTNNRNKVIVVSAVNLIEGGTLNILLNFLVYLKSRSDLKVILLLNPLIKLQTEKFHSFKKVYFSYPKKSWFLRLIFEYGHSYTISKSIKPDIWISLHDITPFIDRKIVSCVYCHNPSPFHYLRIRDFWNLKFVLFCLFYRYLYGINIHRNFKVIVQQDWIREKFETLYNLKNILVCRPDLLVYKGKKPLKKNIGTKEKPLKFIYPSLLRTFKNFEIIIDAFIELENLGYTDKKVSIDLTISPKGSLYSRFLFRRAKNCSLIKFVDKIENIEVINRFQRGSHLIFPSLLETWGLPLTEARNCGSLILAADLPYSRETLRGYNKVFYFDPNNKYELVDAVISCLNKRPYNSRSKERNEKLNKENVGWDKMLHVLEEEVHKKESFDG